MENYILVIIDHIWSKGFIKFAEKRPTTNNFFCLFDIEESYKFNPEKPLDRACAEFKAASHLKRRLAIRWYKVRDILQEYRQYQKWYAEHEYTINLPSLKDQLGNIKK